MSGENTFPSPPPPPPHAGQKERRSPLVLGGVIFGFSPLLFSLVASIFVEDALNESTAIGSIPLLMIFTLPIGLVIFIVGFTNGARNMANRNR
ncbi:MAG: hypothetical protein NTV13_04970 [Actinobacteria bacterium]|nr:hypothetical protein [Actinomycetota bacterium]